MECRRNPDILITVSAKATRISGASKKQAEDACNIPASGTRDSASPNLVFVRISKFGPGIVTGASDDDPSGIATYSQVGAQFGLKMLWTMILSYPLMAAVQEISAR